MMQALWSRYFPSMQKIKELLNDGVLGEIGHVSGNFGFQFENVPRLSDNKLGGGALLDIGVYLVSYCYWIFGTKPTSITSVGRLQNHVDYQTTVIFNYGNAHASISCGFNGEYHNDILIIGSKGSLHIPGPSFWCPTKYELRLKDRLPETFDFPLPASSRDYNYTNSIGLMYEAQYMCECIRNGKTESEEEPLSETGDLMKTLDEIRRQIGLVYPDHDHE